MAKQSTAVAKAETTAVAEMTDAEKLLQQYAGAGVSTKQEDNIVPLLVALQPLSPQVLARNPAQIEGAKPGDLWLRNAPRPIIDGETGIPFQPCFFSKDYVEWLPRPPRGPGGYVGRHVELPANANRHPANPNIWVLPKGNDGYEHELIETRYFVGLAWLDDEAFPYVIPLSSTGHTVAKNWMGQIKAHRDPKTQAIRPAFAYRYLLKSRMRSKADKNWFVLDPVPFDYVGEDAAKLRLGIELFEAFHTGAKVMEQTEQDDSQTQSGDTETGAM